MKKIFFALVTLFAFASCVQEDLPEVGGKNPVDSEYVDLKFSVMIPEMQSATRSFAVPEIRTLHLFVFDESGYISQPLEAKITAEADGNTWEDAVATEYTVENLVSSGYKRIVHLVANLPSGTTTEGYYSENDFFSKLTVEGDSDVYWQRVVLEDGINAETDMGVVPLVRNYAKISVNESLNNFTLTGMMLINIPDMGSVAPYHTTSNGVNASLINGNFAKYDANTDYAALLAQSYYGYEPLDCSLTNQAIPADGAWVSEHYIYERYQRETENRTYVIVRGKYASDSADTYYKVDIINDKGEVYNLLRNISYEISITNVTGSGFATAEAAINSGAASNNLSFAVETRNLLNISDGNSRLFIEYFQKVITLASTDDKTETFTFRYRYVPDITKPTVSQNTSATDGSVVISWSNFEEGIVNGGAVIGDGNATAEGVNWVSNVQLPADSDGYIWNEVTFNVAKRPTDENGNLIRALVQNFTLSAYNASTGATLSRVVELRLVDPFVFDLYVAPKVATAVGSVVPTTLTLPKDLPEGIFPLEFNIVAANNSLTSSLPVVSGLNSDGVPTAGGKYFGYVLTVDYSNYDAKSGMAVYPDFKTNMANAAEAFNNRTDTSEEYHTNVNNNGTKVRAYNPYFEPAFSQFWLGTLYGLQITLNDATATNVITSLPFGTGQQFVAKVTIGSGVPSSYGDLSFDLLYGNGVKIVGIYGEDGTLANDKPGTIVDGKLVVTQTEYASNKTYSILFETTAIKNATTIIARNENFTEASASFTNTSLGTLKIKASDTTLVVGAGSEVDVTVSLPAGIESLFVDDKLVVSLTVGDGYLDLTGDSLTDVNVDKTSSSTYNITFHKDDYDADYGADYVVSFVTNSANSGGIHTITVSQDYLTSASVSTETAKLSFSAININGSTSTQTIHGSGKVVKVNVTLPDDMPESLFANGGLVLTLTATQNTLNAADSGTSGSGTTFTKTVTYAEYSASKVVTFDFTTNSNNFGTNPSWDDWYGSTKTTSVSVSNPYFNNSSSVRFQTEASSN